VPGGDRAGRGLAPAAAQGQFGRGTLHDRMTWEEISQALAKYPPSFDSGLQRMFIMQSMDRLIDFQVQKLSADQRVRLNDAVLFYRRRVEAGLDALERARPADNAAGAKRPGRRFKPGVARRAENVRVLKFFSSSVVLSTSAGTVAIDFAQGPVDNRGEPEVSDPYKTGFYLTRGQRDRLAGLVDVLLITHPRHDHADYSLAKRMVAQRKPVVGPADLKTLWPDLAEGITVPEYEKVQPVGPCEIFTQLGAIDARGVSADPLAPDKPTESVRYLVRMGGIVFFHSAENHSRRRGVAGQGPPAGMARGRRVRDRRIPGRDPSAALPQRAELFPDPGPRIRPGARRRRQPHDRPIPGRQLRPLHRPAPDAADVGEEFVITRNSRGRRSSATGRAAFSRRPGSPGLALIASVF